MNTPPTRPAATRPHPLLLIAALAVILFCAVGTAAIMGWLPNAKGGKRGELDDADRAALAAGLQSGRQDYATLPQPSTPPMQALAAVPVTVPANAQTVTQGYAPAAPVAPVQYGSSAYGSSGTQGSTGAGGGIDAPAPRQADSDSASRACGSCGNVESVRAIRTRAQGSGVGAAGGAILGGLLGNQVGGGHGRQLATVAGAVGGAVVGNQVEGNMKASTSYEIRVRLDNGKLRTFHQQSTPRWRDGDRVRVVKGALRAA